MNIVIVYSKYESFVKREKMIGDEDLSILQETLESMKAGLCEFGYDVILMEASCDLLTKIRELDDVAAIFNLYLGQNDKKEQVKLSAMLSLLPIPLVGSHVCSHILTLMNDLSKTILDSQGISTPKSQIFVTGYEGIRSDFKYPVLVKLEEDDLSCSFEEEIVEDRDALRKLILKKTKKFKKMIIVEECLEGRHFITSIWGANHLEMLAVREDFFETLDDRVKKEKQIKYDLPAKLDLDLEVKIRETMFLTFRALRCKGFANIEFTIDDKGEIFILNVDTMPSLLKDVSVFPIAAEKVGYSYGELLDRLVKLASY